MLHDMAKKAKMYLEQEGVDSQPRALSQLSPTELYLNFYLVKFYSLEGKL